VKFPTQKRKSVLMSLKVLVLVATTVALLFLAARSRVFGLPYQDSFAGGTADEWHALGGTWELADGAIRNESDERGAKLITGSPSWRDYSLEADIQLLGQGGDAGLIARSSDEENGVDSYSGYYAGLRNLDNTLVFGRADHGWIENQAVPMPGGLRLFHWYHLRLIVVGCQIRASAADPSNGTLVSAAMTEKDCRPSGRIGLRSYSSGGAWRNVRAARAKSVDLQSITQGSMRASAATTLVSQDNAPVERTDHEPSLVEKPASLEKPATVARSIVSLRLDSNDPSELVTVRGVVVLTSPLYIQDATGGAAVSHPQAPPLKVGDEVEVLGQPESHDFSVVFPSAKVRLLWPRTPIPPLSVTAFQAATGAFDATFIELEGSLVDKKVGPANTMVLDLKKSDQSFQAIMNPGRGDVLFRQLKKNSLLRLRGICVVDSEYTHNLTPFVLLLRSADDVSVLAGPPWWSAGHLAAIASGALILLLAGQLLYSRVEHWRLRAVLEERERLAHEIHDTIAQSFAGIGFQLQAIQNDLPDKNPTVIRQLNLASDLVRHSHDEARRSIATLRPASLESDGLLPALDRNARRLLDGGSVQVVTSSEGSERTLPVRISDALYKIGQEAVANAVRHASPTSIHILLRYDRTAVRLIVEDDGAGFISATDSLGFGLRGMRKRAERISANLEILSEAGKGTRITVTVPLPPRFSIRTWPAYLWQYFQEHRPHAQDWESNHPYPHRR
jgi:signal transduction histidine kinase